MEVLCFRSPLILNDQQHVTKNNKVINAMMFVRTRKSTSTVLKVCNSSEICASTGNTFWEWSGTVQENYYQYWLYRCCTPTREHQRWQKVSLPCSVADRIFRGSLFWAAGLSVDCGCGLILIGFQGREQILLLVNHAFAWGTPAIFVIFLLFSGSEKQGRLFVVGRMQNQQDTSITWCDLSSAKNAPQNARNDHITWRLGTFETRTFGIISSRICAWKLQRVFHIRWRMRAAHKIVIFTVFVKRPRSGQGARARFTKRFAPYRIGNQPHKPNRPKIRQK